jgi:hypothetical protein
MLLLNKASKLIRGKKRKALWMKITLSFSNLFCALFNNLFSTSWVSLLSCKKNTQVKRLNTQEVPTWMPHIKSRIGYKTDDNHNSRVNTKGQEFIKFTKTNVQQEKKQNTKITNNAFYAHTNASHVSHMSYHDFDVSYVLMRNKFGKVIVLHVGPYHKRSKTCVWVPKCLVTNLKWPNQTWAPKNKA